MAESTLSPGDSTRPHVIRCAECHELVPADRVRHREERVRVAATPTPGEWRAGGPPIFKPTWHGPHVVPRKRPGAEPVPPPQRNAYAVERIPVCVDCLRRQRMGLYGVCAIAGICFLVAVALYSRVEPQSGGEQVALLTPTDSLSRASSATATPRPAPPPALAPFVPPTKKDEAGNSAPIWQPIKDAAASLFASASESPAPAPASDAPPSAVVASASPAAPPAPPTEPAATGDKGSDSSPIWQPILDAASNLFASSSESPTPTPAPASDAAPSSAVVASATPSAAGAAPAPPAATTTSPRPAANAPGAPGSASAPADVAEATSSAPPIWETERKPARKVAKASPPRREAPSANALALRNNGYAALQQRHYREALTMLQQATMMGDAYAPMYIGQLFESGMGVPRDVGQASYWYGIAIDRGNGAALVAFNRMRVSPY